MSNELDRELSKKTPEEIIEMYLTAMNEGNYQLLNAVRSRRALTVDLFRNNDELALFNHQEDEVLQGGSITLKALHCNIFEN